MKILLGKVLNFNMNKTVVVLVKNFFRILKYNKNIKYFTKYYAHDDFNFCVKNDYVYIIQTKPRSKNKFWKIIKIL